jgi:hypothetical protein
MTRKLVIGWLLVTLAALGLTRAVVALPEQCDTPTAAEVDASISEAIGWFERNQNPDGTWLYRYDGPAGVDLGDYNWVRHAGVLISMEQAAAAGYDGAAEVADRGWPVMLDKVIETDRGLAIDALGISTGGTALTGIALGERRLRTDDPTHDGVLRGLGIFVAGQVSDDGSVLNEVDRSTGEPVPGSFSPFATGQAMFLLARLDRLFPDEGWGDTARRIGHYVATERAEREGYVPDTSDHWGAYALSELVRTPGVELTGLEQSFARKQMGIMSIQVRYESQRTNGGIDRWLRGRQTLGAGLGTIGEALGAYRVVADAEPAFDGQRGWLAERLSCAADLLAQRQVGPEEAATHPDPGRSQGAWFQFGITQMDDTRHALSALLQARVTGAVPDDPPGATEEPEILPRRTPVPAEVALVILAAVAALSPTRLVLLGRGCSLVRPSIAGVVILGGLTAVGGPLLRALSISVPTGVAAAGLVLVAAGLWATARGLPPVPDLGDGRATEVRVLMGGLLRPETIVASLAIGAGGQGWSWVLALAVTALAAGLLAARPSSSPAFAAMLGWGVRLAGALAVLTGMGLLVEGIYAI